MTTHRGLILVTVAALAVALFGGPATAGVDGGAAELQHGVGTVVTYHDGGTLERSVEAWVVEDGRYRVFTASLDGTGAAEEVVFDGVTQTAYVTDRGSRTSTVEGDYSTHFAIQTRVPETAPGETIAEFDLAGNGLAERVLRVFDSGTKVELLIAWNKVQYEPSLLNPESTLTFSMETVSADLETIPGTRATGVNSATFQNILDSTACVYAYNYRNTGTGYFRASSSSRGSCYYMDESLWKGSAGSSGSCTVLRWWGSGPTAANFSTKTVYTSPASSSPSCSNHAGWLSDWSLVTVWDGLNTGV